MMSASVTVIDINAYTPVLNIICLYQCIDRQGGDQLNVIYQYDPHNDLGNLGGFMKFKTY